MKTKNSEHMDRRSFILSTGALVGTLTLAPGLSLSKKKAEDTIYTDPFHDLIFLKTRPHIRRPEVEVAVYVDPFTKYAHQLRTFVVSDPHYGLTRVLHYWHPVAMEYQPLDGAMTDESDSLIRGFIKSHRDKYPAPEWEWVRLEEHLEKEKYTRVDIQLVVRDAEGNIDYETRRYEKNSKPVTITRYAQLQDGGRWRWYRDLGRKDKVDNTKSLDVQSLIRNGVVPQ